MQHYAGASSCPEGFAPVATSLGIICAYRGHAPCLGGQVDEHGNFVCTDYDFSCPPGMSTHHGSPGNWCYPDALPDARTGLDLPGSEFFQSLGQSIPQGVESLGRGIADFFQGAPSPIESLKQYGRDTATEAAKAAAREAASKIHVPPMPDVERASREAARGAKAAAAILGVAILGASMIYVFGKK